MNTVALIVAAGKSSRFGEGLPKQYTNIDGIPMLRMSILRFLNNNNIDQVKVVINQNHIQSLGFKAMLFRG